MGTPFASWLYKWSYVSGHVQCSFGKIFLTGIKWKVQPRTDHGGPKGESRYNSTLSSTLVLDVGGWSMLHPGGLTPRRDTWYPSCRKLNGPQGWSGEVWKILLLLGFDPQTVQPIASCYTNYAIPAHTSIHCTNWIELVKNNNIV
jgi:hypothetical protein